MIDLYPYQKEAVESLQGRRAYLLADDMGLGKTVTVLSEIATTGGMARVLIVCPNSVKGVWDDHLEMLIPEAKRVIVGNKGHRLDAARFHDDPEARFLVVHWDALRILPRLPEEDWDCIIVDEVHYAKNRKAQRTKALKKLKAEHKRALSGTPMVNRPDELWSILNWLWPKDFTSYWRFFDEYCEWRMHPKLGFKEFRGPRNQEGLHRLLADRMVRRKKEEVLLELPDKYYTKIVVDLAPKQRKAYDEMKKHSLTVVDPDTPIMAPSVLTQLMRLRQFASAYCLVEWDDESAPVVTMTEPSPKLDALMEIVDEAGGRPVVVFSMFKQMIRLATARLAAAGVSVYSMTGDTKAADRDAMIEGFQAGERSVFLATIQTGGIGITLTAADTCVFLDRSWSPADNRQAEDRLHRIGQENAVQIISIDGRDTVDQVIEDALRSKHKMFREIVEGG